MRLLVDSTSNTKLAKSEESRYRIVSLPLAPADSTPGIPTVCSHSTAGCRSACVGGPNVGLASVWTSIMEARQRKTRLFHDKRKEFLLQLVNEIDDERRKADMRGEQLVCRLNTFSDIPWEHGVYGSIPQRFPSVIFYDYTKRHSRRFATEWPKNYHLCHSWDETARGQEECKRILLSGGNVSIVFAKQGNGYTGPRALLQPLPKRFKLNCEGKDVQFMVHDGDTSDLRFNDPACTRSGHGRIIGLRLKAANNAAHESAIASGFAVIW